jgi:hypothetical protein
VSHRGRAGSPLGSLSLVPERNRLPHLSRFSGGWESMVRAGVRVGYASHTSAAEAVFPLPAFTRR